MNFFVYILESQKNSKLYIGHTNNIERRLSYHNNGYSKSTKNGIPWKLIHTENYATRSEAMNRELDLKKLKNPKYNKEVIIAGRASR